MSWEEYQKQLEEDYQNRAGIVFMMDLDNFKLMNDTYGHNFGDQILKEFVCTVKQKMNRKFRLFRYGGDEFILVVPTTVEEYSDVYYEVSNMLFLQNEHWRKQGLAVSVSFGNADLSEQDSIVNIVRKADKLMYMNKFEKSIVRSSNG